MIEKERLYCETAFCALPDTVSFSFQACLGPLPIRLEYSFFLW